MNKFEAVSSLDSRTILYGGRLGSYLSSHHRCSLISYTLPLQKPTPSLMDDSRKKHTPSWAFGLSSQTTYKFCYLIEGNQRLFTISVPSTMEVDDLIELIYQRGKDDFFRGVNSVNLALFKVCGFM